MKTVMWNRLVCAGLVLVAGCAAQPKGEIEPAQVAPVSKQSTLRIEQSAQVRDLVTGERRFVFCAGAECQLVSQKVFASPAKAVQVPPSDPATAAPKLYSVAFSYNSAKLSKEAIETLAMVVKEAATAKQIRIMGKADSLNRDAYNRALAGRRAETVKQYLVANGVSIPIGSSADIVRVTPEGVYPPGETFKGRRVDLELIVEIVKP